MIEISMSFLGWPRVAPLQWTRSSMEKEPLDKIKNAKLVFVAKQTTGSKYSDHYTSQGPLHLVGR